MSKFAIRLLALAMYSMALIAAPLLFSLMPRGGETPSPPPDTKSRRQEEQKNQRRAPASTIPDFIEGYRAAYATIYDRNDYAAAIEQLKALGQDDRADVANLIGYSYRKLGDYKVSQIWYERALKADPNHVRTWQYYGLWQLEQGNRDQAQYHLTRIGELCGTDCAGISLARRGTRKAARHRPRLLISATSDVQPARLPRAAPVLFCRIASRNMLEEFDDK